VSPRLRIGAVLAAVLVAVVAVADLLLLDAVQRARDDASARQDAMQAARTLVPVLLSYDQKSLAADLARARRNTTGNFREDFDKLVTDVVRPTAEARHVTTSAVVSSAGVISASRDRVTVLVFVTQTSTSSVRKTPAVTGSRVKVVMARTPDHWLIAGLDPV
jgi:Mce-associated membrane protein